MEDNWESLFKAIGDVPSCTGPSEDAGPLASSPLAPLPLRLRSSTPSSRQPPPSPPQSPTPAVLVSLHHLDPDQAATHQLSLHQYRKDLSRPRPHAELQSGSVPPKPLKRKTKTLNLNCMRQPPAPLSPPQTPRLSPSPFTEESIPEQPILPTYEEFSNSSKREVEVDQPQYFTNPHSSRLHAFLARLWHIPDRFVSHNKSSSEPALSSKNQKRRTLRHRGTSFEILDPRESTYSYPVTPKPTSSSSHHQRAISTSHSRTMEDLNNPRTPHASRSRSVDGNRRVTPSRALFADLPTAHSSITSRRTPGRRPSIPSLNLNNADECARTPSKGQPHYELEDFIDCVIPPLPSNDPNHASGASFQSTILAQDEKTNHSNAGIPTLMSTTEKRVQFPSGGRRKPAKLVKPRPRSHAEASDPLMCCRVRPVLADFLNRHQPSLHGARGRIDKVTTIRKMAKPKFINPGVKTRVARHEEVRPKSTTAPTEGENRDLELEDLELASVPIDHERSVTSNSSFSRPIPPGPGQWLSGRSLPALHSSSGRDSSLPSKLSKSSSAHDGAKDYAQRHHTPPPSRQFGSNLGGEDEAEVPQDALFGSCSRVTRRSDVGLGPGSSQSSSSQSLSSPVASSAALRPPLNFESFPSAGSLEYNSSGPFGPGNIRMHHPTTGTQNDKTENKQVETHDEPGELDDDAEHDWETVAGSQQFYSFASNTLSYADTTRSLANHPSLKGRTKGLYNNGLLRSTGYFPPDTYSSTGTTASTQQNHHSGLYSPVGKPPPISSNYAYSHAPVPALRASTSRRPAPFIPSSYQHPTPLADSHRNPFCDSPPSLARSASRDEWQMKDTSSGCISVVRSSKSSLHGDDNNQHPTQTEYFMDAVSRPPGLSFHSSGWYPNDTTPHNFNSAHPAGSHQISLNPWSQNSIRIPVPAAVADSNTNSTNPMSLTPRCRPISVPFHSPGTSGYFNNGRPSNAGHKHTLSTDPLIPREPPSKQPGSLYLSVRSARQRVLGHTNASSLSTIPGTQNYRTPRESDDLIRERLQSIDTTAMLSTGRLPPNPSPGPRISGTTLIPPWHPCHFRSGSSPTRSYTMGHRPSLDEESTLQAQTDNWYGRYTFSEPPHLTPSRHRRCSTNLVAQKQTGRATILWASLAGPVGWIVLALIGMGGWFADRLIQWRSREEEGVDEFHEVEVRLARRLSMGFAGVVFVMAIVVVVVVLAT